MENNSTHSNELKQVETSLPSSWYCDPSHHRIEEEQIWQKDWVYL